MMDRKPKSFRGCLSFDIPTNKPDWYTENAVWFTYDPKKGSSTEYSKYGNEIIPNRDNRLISDEVINKDENAYGVSTINGKLRQLTIHHKEIIYRINNTPLKDDKCDEFYCYDAELIPSNANSDTVFDILDDEYITNRFADKKGFANLTVNGRTGETMQLSGFSIGAESSIQMDIDKFVKVILRAETDKNVSEQPTFIMKVNPNFDFKGYLQLTVVDYGVLKSPEINIPKGATYLYTFSKEEVEKVIGITPKEEKKTYPPIPTKQEEKKKYISPISTRDLIIHPDDAIFDRKTGIALKISLIDAVTKHKYRVTVNPDSLINRLNKETVITKYEAISNSIYQFIKTDGTIYFDKENRNNYINFILTITHHITDKTELPSIELKLWKFDHVEPFSAYLDIASNRKFIFHTKPAKKITLNKENYSFIFKYSALANKVYCYE